MGDSKGGAGVTPPSKRQAVMYGVMGAAPRMQNVNVVARTHAPGMKVTPGKSRDGSLGGGNEPAVRGMMVRSPQPAGGGPESPWGAWRQQYGRALPDTPPNQGRSLHR